MTGVLLFSAGQVAPALAVPFVVVQVVVSTLGPSSVGEVFLLHELLVRALGFDIELQIEGKGHVNRLPRPIAELTCDR